MVQCPGLVGVKCVYQPQNKSKSCHDYANERVPLSTVKQVLSQCGMKNQSKRKKPLLQKKYEIPDYSLQMHSGTKNILELFPVVC